MSLEVRSEAATHISIAMPWDPDRKQYVATRDLDSANSIGKVVQPHFIRVRVRVRVRGIGKVVQPHFCPLAPNHLLV